MYSCVNLVHEFIQETRSDKKSTRDIERISAYLHVLQGLQWMVVCYTLYMYYILAYYIYISLSLSLIYSGRERERERARERERETAHMTCTQGGGEIYITQTVQ